MFQLTVSFATVEGLQDAVLKLSGDASQLNLPVTTAQPKTKAADKKAAAAAATVEGLDAPKTPAAPKAGRPAKSAKTHTLDELKKHVATFVDPATEGDRIKEFARSFGVAKYGDLTEEQIQEAYAGAEEYFAAGDAAGEPDPMD